MPRVLIRFTHGLGDNVQLGCVLGHLRRHRPDWEVHLLTQPGKETLFRGRCASAVADERELAGGFDHTFDLGWYENYNAYPDCPNTKVTNCLREVFGVEPDPALLRYEVHPDADDLAAAAAYYRGLGLTAGADGRFPVIVAHHKGNTSPEKKDLADADLVPLAVRSREYGLTVVVLDWDERTGGELREAGAVVCSHLSDPVLWKGMGTGDGGRIAALMRLAKGWVGIDSGPGHVGGGVPTPGVVVWVRHHPIMFYDLCPNVTHLVPEHLDRLPPADRPGITAYFRAHYNHYAYTHLPRDLAAHALAAAGVAPCPVNPMSRSHLLKATNFHVEYYEEHRAAGLDYLGHGEWQESYGRWVADALGVRGEHVLDVGCACGSIALGLRKAGALSHGVDLNNHMIRLGQERFPGVPLYVCDAVNLHLFGPGSFKLVHSNQVGEHWKPELVPFILEEFHRVLAPDGVVFTVLDTADLFERQGRQAEVEDPTNACVRPLAWWRERFAAAGFAEAPDLGERLAGHPGSFFRRYDWDWMVHRRV